MSSTSEDYEGGGRSRGAPQAGRDGNWTCGQCSNINYASRDYCNRCRALKPVWICPKCQNDNYPFRKACNRCGLSRPDPTMTMGLGMHGAGAGLSSIHSAAHIELAARAFVMCFAHETNPLLAAITYLQQSSGQLGHQIGSYPGNSSYGGGAFPQYSGGRRSGPPIAGVDGNWKCDCGNVNFSNRTKCNRCAKPKVEEE